MSSNSKSFILMPLLGGLGNQLFQLSALQNYSESHNVFVDEEMFGAMGTEFAKYITNSEVEPKVSKSMRFSRLSRRLCGLLIRTGTWERKALVKTILVPLAELVLSIRYKSGVKVVASHGVGFAKIGQLNPTKNYGLLGYFQSDKYVQNLDFLGDVDLYTKCKFIDLPFKPCDLADSEKPLIVHIRRGDYLSDSRLGVLAKNYYHSNLKRVLEESGCRNIWAFGNDPESLLEFIPKELHKISRVMEFDHLSNHETFLLMTLGHGYMIANSTFSWWAAQLSSAPRGNIFAPQPWFANSISPIGLIPNNWKVLKADFEFQNS